MITINCDGGSRGNPGPAAIGIVIRKDGIKIDSCSEYIGKATNNVAEYMSLIRSLEIAVKHTQGQVHVFMDSQLVIMQVTGKYRINKPHLKKLYDRVKENESSFKEVIYAHVRRDNLNQSEADALVNQALDNSIIG